MINGVNYNKFNFIANNRRTIQQMSDTFKGLAKNIFNFGLNYIEENEEVFNGNVSEETTKIISHIHNLGVVMREGQTKHTFDRTM